MSLSSDEGPVHAETASTTTSSTQKSTVTSLISDEVVHKPHSSSVSCEPKQLISQGVSFFSGLAEILKSPEATQQLIDNIVDVDEETGEANIKIPMASKETVMQMFSLFSKLMGQ